MHGGEALDAVLGLDDSRTKEANENRPSKVSTERVGVRR
jgi:hypothetical protein